MSFTHKISSQITKGIGTQLPHKTKDQLAIINYGLETLLMNTYKIIIIFYIAHLLKVFNLSLMSFLMASLIRFFSAGVHAKNWWLCLAVSTFNIVGTSYLAISLTIPPPVTGLILVSSLMTFYIYAPADTKAKPIINKTKRQMNKKGSLLSTLVIFAIVLITKNQVLMGLFTLNLLTLSFYISPWAYRLFGQSYNNHRHYTKKETL